MNKLDARPGAPPDIHIGPGGITFAVQPRGIPHGDVLVIRCDATGGVWLAIGTGADAGKREMPD